MSEAVSFDHVIKYRVCLELATPMHVGASFSDRNEVLLHPVDGLPFVQASSIAGGIREYYTKKRGEKKASELFGSSEDGKGSRIVVADGVFNQDTVKFEMRPRVKIDSVSGTVSKTKAKGADVSSGHKFDMECIGAGGAFEFDLYVKGADFSDADDIVSVLSAFNDGGITIGGQRSNGFGDIKITKLLCRKFDLNESGDFEDWIGEAGLDEDRYEDITLSLVEKKYFAYRITANAKTEGGILVKGYGKEGFGKKGSDASNIQDARGNYIIPGSSIKGSIRNQIERILKYRGYSDEKKKELISDIFGEAESTGKAGNIICYDSIIELPKGTRPRVSHRIHIDKVSGGVMNTGLFNEERVFGSMVLRMDISERNNPELSCGYMLMAIRDLALNLYNLGSGYNIGNGMVKIDTITIETKDGMATFDLKSGVIADDSGIVDRCIKAIAEV